MTDRDKLRKRQEKNHRKWIKQPIDGMIINQGDLRLNRVIKYTREMKSKGAKRLGLRFKIKVCKSGRKFSIKRPRLLFVLMAYRY